MSAASSPRADLPPYTVRVSQRARSIRLTVTAREGLVVVVPRGMRVDANAIIASKWAWADRALSSLAEKRALHLGGPRTLLPDSVELRSLGRTLRVHHESGVAASRVRVRESGDTLVVTGPDDPAARIAALSRWLDRGARAWLPVRLSQLAKAHGFEYTHVRVTSARSRWGSCSSRGTISLNRTLMFLPPELVDALLLHELAHTRVLDHSPRFWALLGSVDPETLAHRHALRAAGASVPAWAEA